MWRTVRVEADAIPPARSFCRAVRWRSALMRVLCVDVVVCPWFVVVPHQLSQGADRRWSLNVRYRPALCVSLTSRSVSSFTSTSADRIHMGLW